MENFSFETLHAMHDTAKGKYKHIENNKMKKLYYDDDKLSQCIGYMKKYFYQMDDGSVCLYEDNMYRRLDKKTTALYFQRLPSYLSKWFRKENYEICKFLVKPKKNEKILHNQLVMC